MATVETMTQAAGRYSAMTQAERDEVFAAMRRDARPADRAELDAAETLVECLAVMRGHSRSITVCYPRLPGLPTTEQHRVRSMHEARTIASRVAGSRPDLTYCSVEIRLGGERVGFAGPPV